MKIMKMTKAMMMCKSQLVILNLAQQHTLVLTSKEELLVEQHKDWEKKAKYTLILVELC